MTHHLLYKAALQALPSVAVNTMSCGQNQSECGCGCSGSFDLFAPLGLGGLSSGLGDITDERCGGGCVVYWRGEVSPGWWIPRVESKQDKFLDAVEARLRNLAPLVAGASAKAQNVHRGNYGGTSTQTVIDAFITVQMGTEAGIYLVKDAIEQAITMEGGSVVNSPTVQIANNPSGVGPPAVDPDEFYQPDYEYPADNIPDLGLFKFDPLNSASLWTYALLAGGAFVVYKFVTR